MTDSKFHPESLNAPEIQRSSLGFMPLMTRRPLLTNSSAHAKRKAPQTSRDQLTKLIDLTLPLKFNQLTQRIENDGEPIDGDFLGTLYIQLMTVFSRGQQGPGARRRNAPLASSRLSPCSGLPRRHHHCPGA